MMQWLGPSVHWRKIFWFYRCKRNCGCGDARLRAICVFSEESHPDSITSRYIVCMMMQCLGPSVCSVKKVTLILSLQGTLWAWWCKGYSHLFSEESYSDSITSREIIVGVMMPGLLLCSCDLQRDINHLLHLAKLLSPPQACWGSGSVLCAKKPPVSRNILVW